jgi:ATP-binding cassette subfamily A (ABC1) protein 3
LCYIFLSIIGGGKTSALKILTGDMKPSRGRVVLGGIDIAEQPDKLSRLIGYCPQFDALHEQLTARETLHFYARIRGVPSKNINMMIKYLLDRLTITEYADRPVKTYSGGTKRKLSVAVALVGSPLIVMLDEPSVRGHYTLIYIIQEHY